MNPEILDEEGMKNAMKGISLINKAWDTVDGATPSKNDIYLTTLPPRPTNHPSYIVRHLFEYSVYITVT